VAPQRELPFFARQRFVDWFRVRGPRGDRRRGPVVLWPDTFTNSFQPGIARAAVEVLEHAGFSTQVPTRAVCCGLTWISTGQLATARRVLHRTLDVLRPKLRDGVPILVLESSCAAVFREDAPRLLADEDVRRLAEQTVTLAELLDTRVPQWGCEAVATRAIVQPHCHQHAVLGCDADLRVMRRCGIDAELLDVGCCGLAGNFGFERGHYDVSMRCAELGLLPAIRAADAGTLVVADGFSCRTQIEQARVGRRAWHLAEVLAAAVRGERLR